MCRRVPPPDGSYLKRIAGKSGGAIKQGRILEMPL